MYVLLIDLFNIFPLLGINITVVIGYIAYREIRKHKYTIESGIGIKKKIKNYFLKIRFWTTK